MSQAFEALQDLLLSQEPDYNTLHAMLSQARRSLAGVELARVRPITRLLLALEGYREKRTGAADIAVLLRQMIRSHHARLCVTAKLWQSLAHQAEQAGLHAVVPAKDGTVTLVADDWRPDWLPAATAAIDSLELRRFGEPAIGDSVLFSMADFLSYQSAAQKAAVTSCFYAPPGSTTLVTLPTGAGKSLCSLLPAWFDSGGGRLEGGTTLVVVPTVSLALDQAQQADQRFAGAQNSRYSPHARISSTSKEEQAIIRQGLRDGTLPILYTSPESIIHSELYYVLLEAAAAGKITRLVIDEAHLVQSWGAGFRTEFQFLATYRRKLLENSRGQLRTILLSATVSRECDDLLEALFAEPGYFNAVRGNRLRPEPSYWFDLAPTLEIRRRRVVEALYSLPRPAILYVTKLDDAREWRALLRAEQFRRLAVFTGETPAAKREELVSAWNADKIDLMIATSAFGLGVDKPDVRTVVHACLPESANRFYQEVGRAGRDGCSAVSLLCAAPGDADVARGMTRSALIKTSGALDRWRGMQRSAHFAPGHGDELAVDTNALPFSKPDMQPSDLNQEWNEHTLLLMQRGSLIEILTTREENSGQDQPDTAEEPAPLADAGRLQIRLLRTDLIAEPKRLEEEIEKARNRERAEISESTRVLLEIVRRYGPGSPRRCLAQQFAGIYPGAALACGGCPYCCRAGLEPYAQPLPVTIDIEAALTSQTALKPNLARATGGHHCLNLFWDGHRSIDRVKELAPDVMSLIMAGLQQIIMPAEVLKDGAWVSQLISQLARAIPLPSYVLLSDEQLAGGEELPVIDAPTLIVYPHGDGEADRFYARLRPHLSGALRRQLVINVVHYAVRLDSEQGRFLDRVDGLAFSLQNFRSTFAQPEELALL